MMCDPYCYSGRCEFHKEAPYYVMCKRCFHIICSESTRERKACPCGAVAVKGGKKYTTTDCLSDEFLLDVTGLLFSAGQYQLPSQRGADFLTPVIPEISNASNNKSSLCAIKIKGSL